MDSSYREMMRGYAEHQKSLANKPDWVHNKTKNSKEPDELTVTHINQTQDLFVSGMCTVQPLLSEIII